MTPSANHLITVLLWWLSVQGQRWPESRYKQEPSCSLCWKPWTSVELSRNSTEGRYKFKNSSNISSPGKNTSNVSNVLPSSETQSREKASPGHQRGGNFLLSWHTVGWWGKALRWTDCKQGSWWQLPDRLHHTCCCCVHGQWVGKYECVHVSTLWLSNSNSNQNSSRVG